MRLLKNLVPLLIGTLIVVSLAIIPISANNHTDTYYTFNFTGGSPNQQRTTFRDKLDTTSSWLNCYSMSDTQRVFTAWVVASYEGGSEVNVSNNYYYTWYYLKKGYLNNWAWEWKGDCPDDQVDAAIRASAGPFDIFKAYVKWSPDSI